MAANETWKPIPGFDGYEVSDLGRVRSLDRLVLQPSRNGKLYARVLKGRLLKASVHIRDGHLQIHLGRGSGTVYVHQLVLLAFKGKPPKGHECCHNDNDPANAQLGNLRYDTRSGNLADRP